MAYAAVTSLMETLSLHFLQSQPRFPLEGLEEQIRDGNENLGLLQQILEKSEIANDDAGAMNNGEDEASSSIKACLPRLHGIFNNEAVKQTDYHPKKKKLIKSEKLLQQQQLAESSSPNERIINAWDSILLTSRLREVAEIKQRIVSLHQNLGLLQQSLEKSEIPYDDARVMKHLEAQIRDASFKLEERIEMELSTIYLAKDNLHITACVLRLHQIFNEAQKLTDYHRDELIRIQTEYQPAKVSLLGRIRRRGLQLVKGSSLIVSNFSKKASKFDGGMVGCEKLFEKILRLLTQQTTKGRQVVSIVGMGGIGKTTLAHKLYQHPSITSYFDMQAWVTVSQEFNKEQMLRCLIGCVTATSKDELHKQSTNQDQLAERLRKHLKEQRYLIVMDDIWSITAWDSVQRCFPDDNNGSRILLTSRLREVGEYASSGNSPLNMPFLDADESWNLYCKVFGKTEFLLVFEQIGRDIVKKCKGLPLAITIVASLLSKTEEEEEKWKNVAKGVMGDSTDACSRILYLSYNQLPHHLKACFLYFGIFEEDYEIVVKKLVRLWAGEGFLSTVNHVNLEKVAMQYLQDLVDRSLVIVSKYSYNGKMKKIKIHDLLRDLCLREARLENLLNVNGVRKHGQWISHTSMPFYHEVRFEDKCFDKPHSFHLTRLYFSANVYIKGLFSHLKLLRVLDMRESFLDGDTNLNMFANLVHLRYLALYIHGLCCVYPNHFGRWNNLQTFIVSWGGAKLYSCESSGFWKMPLLRNFCIGRICSLETPSVVHRNLENISWLDSKLCTKDLFTMIPNLKTLGVDGDHYANSIDCFYNFVHLEQLEKLSIRRWMKFDLDMCNIPWATSLPNLKKLSFLESTLQWCELSAISMLPNLEVLKLIDACRGPKWETSNGGFNRLKRLVIKKSYLRCWNAVGDHFPILECLEISDCSSLKEIPRGFADITTLALIQLSKCMDSLVVSAKWIQEEQKNNYGNDALLVRAENIYKTSSGKWL
ncbi:putative late blight resistance protein homolog R1B-17 [Ipomoea triloba]|uniref:putative late blight resistance protein homolog R1B-17 n=1 Tax=Ipomoea triloba TaxID=35885 RepID=UPI00125D2AF7|nr:putative late blight resistance protein homolog R1B-17 [Ipomoea triloba]XP_031091351.1 putative late blight resistance protein homolog R1B-17 [Ipomoea triloba]